MPKVAVIDCGVGNLFSISYALRKTGLDADIVSASKRLRNIAAVVLPGVGNFKAGSQNLKALGQEVIGLVEAGAPLFGICLGMQLLFEESEESPGKGLGLLRGKVIRLPKSVKTPHMGWNTLKIIRHNELLEGIGDSDYFYYVHSYYVDSIDKNFVIAETAYGLNFASVIAKKNIYGTQFHPEKSGKPGKHVLQNFAKIVKK